MLAPGEPAEASSFEVLGVVFWAARGENTPPMPWIPKLAPIDLRSLPLTGEEGFVVSRIDGQTSVEQLSLLSGLSRERVDTIVARLVETGAVFAPPVSVAAPVEAPMVEATLGSEPEPPGGEDGEAPLEDDGASGSHLKLYREAFHELGTDERTRLASVERGARLSALCFDPLPAVVHAVLQNPNAGPEQARLIAAHHRNSAGLEWLVLRADLMRDAQVQRLLWRNPQLNEGQLRRLVASKRLLELWKLTVSREVTTQTRAGTAKLLRARFTTASSEEKIELIFTTEGRSLAGLSGIPVDGKTSALLCGRSYSSQMLVQNIAHWSAAPPQLIAHLLKQPMVIRQPQLRTALSRHPNAPSSAKR